MTAWHTRCGKHVHQCQVPMLADYKRLLSSQSVTAEEPSKAKNFETQKWQKDKGNILQLRWPWLCLFRLQFLQSWSNLVRNLYFMHIATGINLQMYTIGLLHLYSNYSLFFYIESNSLEVSCMANTPIILHNCVMVWPYTNKPVSSIECRLNGVILNCKTACLAFGVVAVTSVKQ